MDLTKEKPVLVAGAGKSGCHAVTLLIKTGFETILYDGNPKLEKEKIAKTVGSDAFRLELGELSKETVSRVQCCVMSPGISLDKPFVRQLAEAGVPLISEISLAYYFTKGTVGTVTGTNGKTTTTTLIGHIMKAVNPLTQTVGNIGTPYSEHALETTEDSLTLIEVSSFQLETIDDIIPQVHVITNIRQDHLDRHGTIENYVALKKKLCLKQRPDQFTVINGDDPWLADVPQLTKARVLRFSSSRELEEGCFLRGDRVILRLDGAEHKICRRDEIQLLGMHNVENVMTGILAACALGAPVEVIRRQVLSFTAVPHRMEYVCTVNGALYYNDSKATNPDSVVKAMEVVTPPVILIAGGFDRHADYREMVDSFRDKVRYLILLGTTAQDIAACVQENYPIPTEFVTNMEEAVALARRLSQPGDTVLLSPACASWDMYPSFEVRGDEFKALARAALPEETAIV